MLHVLACLAYLLFALFSLVISYAVSGLAKLLVTQYFSHLGELNCPPVPSFFWGHLQLLHDAENTNLYMKWREQMGNIFTYRGFIGGRRLVTMDTRAITHILSQPHEYPKPSFVRDTLASMSGEHGLLVVEGDVHKRQRKILSPSFTAPQVRELTPIFYDKAIKLRDIWLEHIESAPSRKTLTVSRSIAYNPKPTHKTLLAPATPTLPLTPPPRSGSPPSTLRLRSRQKVLSKQLEDSALTREQQLLRCQSINDNNLRHSDEPFPTASEDGSTTDLESYANVPRARIDVLNWLGRATLDVIGLAGFGYTFDSLVDDQNVLATAFSEVFSAARKLRFMIVLQAWFPILHHFRANRNVTDRSLRTMHRIGMDLIHTAQERLACSGEALSEFDFRDRDKKARISSEDVQEDEEQGNVPMGHGPQHQKTLKGRDLLSLLIKSNMATRDKERMSQSEILSQISTFMAAGHETTSSALTWTLYALSQNPDCQLRLRAEITAVASPTPSPETLNELQYLDMVVRESLRLYSPVSQTMRVATRDDIVPVAVPYRDAKGRTRKDITIKKGDIISIPIQAMNKCESVFGQNAEKFIPERWEHPPDANAMPALYSSILTFLYGGRACIGYRFALLEMKAFLFVLIRSICFETCPDIVIEKRLNVVTRPLVKSEPERGNQMPLLLSRAREASPSPTLPPLRRVPSSSQQ